MRERESMQERGSGIDFFAQSAALIESVCELQRGFADELFERFRHGEEKGAAVDAVTESCRNLFNGIANNPSRIAERQVEYWQQQLQLCSNFLRQLLGEEVEPLVQPQANDRRFDDPEWSGNPLFDYIKQSYLLTADNALQAIAELEGVEPRDRERLNYFMRQLINALAPTNFALTNPDVLRTTLATQGNNLVEGLRMMVEDKKRSADILNVCISKPNAFSVGIDIAHTPGSVVAENELMQLIQYAPTTPRVKALPVLIVPSWVNKYYVLDLTEKNSFVRWLVAQGYTVFAISWVNPDASHREVEFSDYVQSGPLFAAEQIERITGAPQVAGVGYCLGGILLACTLAYGERTGERRFAAATYLAASVDFTDPGDINVLVDEHVIDSVEWQMRQRGYLDGRLLAAGFNLLRENDLYWNYYVTNYLKGERPVAFDLLHWNSDSTNVPEATHRFVMRELHLGNGLVKAGGVNIRGHALDLRDIVTPTYVLAAESDHIARWRSCYAVTQLQRGDVRFVLTGSGHIAGVINPPAANKYYYYSSVACGSSGAAGGSAGAVGRSADSVGGAADIADERSLDADAWLERAQRSEGSWWCDWVRWLDALSGPVTGARAIDEQHVIEPAPGRYVRRRLDAEPTPAYARSAA